jgi:hypothetical protein
VTGFLQFEYPLSGKWLELLKQIAPGVIREAIAVHGRGLKFRSAAGATRLRVMASLE